MAPRSRTRRRRPTPALRCPGRRRPASSALSQSRIATRRRRRPPTIQDESPPCHCPLGHRGLASLGRPLSTPPRRSATLVPWLLQWQVCRCRTPRPPRRGRARLVSARAWPRPPAGGPLRVALPLRFRPLLRPQIPAQGSRGQPSRSTALRALPCGGSGYGNASIPCNPKAPPQKISPLPSRSYTGN